MAIGHTQFLDDFPIKLRPSFIEDFPASHVWLPETSNAHRWRYEDQDHQIFKEGICEERFIFAWWFMVAYFWWPGALIDSLLNSLPIRKSCIVQELIFYFWGTQMLQCSDNSLQHISGIGCGRSDTLTHDQQRWAAINVIRPKRSKSQSGVKLEGAAVSSLTQLL